MSFCHHQFFTREDLDAGRIVFADPAGNVVGKDWRDEVLSRYARPVGAEYVFGCTVSHSVFLFDYFPLRHVEAYLDGLPCLDGRYTRGKYLDDVRRAFGGLGFCSDGAYAARFGELFGLGFFPESCRAGFRALKAVYSGVSRASVYEEVSDRVKAAERAIAGECRRLLGSAGFFGREFLDLEYSSSRTGVYPKYGHDPLVLKSTTC